MYIYKVGSEPFPRPVGVTFTTFARISPEKLEAGYAAYSVGYVGEGGDKHSTCSIHLYGGNVLLESSSSTLLGTPKHTSCIYLFCHCWYGSLRH